MKLINQPRLSSLNNGFTLIELLTVITIIALLAAIIIPSVGKVRENALRAKSASDIRSIAQAYAAYSAAGSRMKTIPATVTTIQEWASFLAKEIDLNDASLYYIESDPQVAALSTLPLVIGSDTENGFTLDSEFQAAAPSYAVVAGLSINAPTTTTPLIFTRGLNSSGKWSDTSPWGTQGGHIGFLDGHVKFYKDLSVDGGQLVHYKNKSRTSNIQEAISAGAIVLNNTP